MLKNIWMNTDIWLMLHSFIFSDVFCHKLLFRYGSVPHKLIEFALKRYQVPEDWIDLILAYYDGLSGRITASGISSDWAR